MLGGGLDANMTSGGRVVATSDGKRGTSGAFAIGGGALRAGADLAAAALSAA